MPTCLCIVYDCLHIITTELSNRIEGWMPHHAKNTIWPFTESLQNPGLASGTRDHMEQTRAVLAEFSLEQAAPS